MHKALIAAKFPEKEIEILKQNFEITVLENPSKESLLKAVEDTEVLIVRSSPLVDKDVIKAGKNLKIIGRPGTGLDNIDVAEAKKQNIQVLNTPNANSAAVAELVFAILLSLFRKIREADFSMKKGLWNKNSLMGSELNGKTIGVVGMGKIGRIISKIGQSFGMKIVGFDPFLPKEEFEKLGVEFCGNLIELLKNSDIITLHLPKTPQTENLITEKEFKEMKPSAILVNCARGGIVNEKALYQALTNGQIAGAGIDTWETEPTNESPLRDLPNVIALPHIGASTYEAQKKCATDLIDQIVKIYADEKN